jgi:hypothetical protein
MCSYMYYVQNDYGDRIDGARLRLWTAASNGPLVHAPDHTWAWRTMVEWYWQGKPLIRPTELSGNPANSHLVARQEVLSEESYEFCQTKYFCSCFQGIFNISKKSFDMGPTALLPLRRKVCCGFLSHWKISRPRPGLNQRILGPMACALANTPPRTSCASYVDCDVRM